MCQKIKYFLKIRKTGGFGGLEGQKKHFPRYFSLNSISKIFDIVWGERAPGKCLFSGMNSPNPPKMLRIEIKVEKNV